MMRMSMAAALPVKGANEPGPTPTIYCTVAPVAGAVFVVAAA
jgi:hypothetical protein